MSLSRRRTSSLLGALTAACLCAFWSPAAEAELGPIQLISTTPKEQANFAREAALSGNGDYVAFVGELGGKRGLFRKSLNTGALTLVVAGAAEAPSISAEGNLVSFTTRQSLEPVLDPGGTSNDVYVANLSGFAPAFQLASATEGHRMPGESTAAPRVALSADGTEVAFVDEGQVYVRRLGEEKPVLVTTRRDRTSGTMTSEPVPNGGALGFAGAALSPDGNAVAWVGERLPEQVPLSAGEEAVIAEIEQGATSESERGNRYFEPLWRLVPIPGQEGPPAPPTRRIVGDDEGLFPKLDANHGARELRNYEGFGWGINLPQLSADGSTVAVIGSPEDDNDLFVVNMDPDLSRVQAVHQVTRWTNPVPSMPSQVPLFEHAEYLAFTGPIKQCAISPNGRYVAFTTLRQNFPLAPPTLITPRPSALPTVVELYQLDLTGGTIERITPSSGPGVSAYPGNVEEPATANAIAGAKYGEAPLGASGPSYRTDGLELAFASKADNYVGGDANEESDVFTVASTPPAPVEESKISPRPSALSVIPSWKLTVHAVSRPNGAIRVVAGVPGAGSVEALAMARVGSKAKSQKVSAGQRRATAAGIVRLELHLPQKLRKLAHRKGGLYAALDIRFTGSGGRPLEQQIVARFRAHAKKKPKAGHR